MEGTVISLEDVSKYYKLYDSPQDRLKEALRPGNKKYYREFYALKNINLNVRKGEILGIVGRNGSGKSTLLKLIAGVLEPNLGTVTVKGNVSALLELGSGFNPNFTGYQNIYFYGTILGYSRKEMDGKLESILDFAELGDFIYQPLKTYSSGMKSRLGFSVAVHVDPEILILDEVLSVGDALFQRKCYAKMEEFFNSGKTILYVSHNADTVNQLCSRAVMIESGSIVMDGDTKSVTTQYQRILFSNKSESVGASVPDAFKRERDPNPVRPESEIVYHKDYFLPGLVSKSRIEYRNENVQIENSRIINKDGYIVNLLNFNEQYELIVDYKFGICAENVAFGLDLKDIKGVKVASIESSRMYERGNCFSVNKGDVYTLKYSFRCLFRSGVYYINCGVSSYVGVQKVLNRIIDMHAFKTINSDGFSLGFLDLIEDVLVDDGKVKKMIKVHN